MDTAMTLNWLETRRVSNARVRLDQETRMLKLARDNARLEEEIGRLMREKAELAASAELWIRLYEAALNRANSAEAALSELTV